MHPDPVPLASPILQFQATHTRQPVPRKPFVASARTSRGSPRFWAVSRRWMCSRLTAPCAIGSYRAAAPAGTSGLTTGARVTPSDDFKIAVR